MKEEKLFESVYNYSDHEGIFENELVTPLENNNMEELFEDVYFEGYLEPLFEQVFREAHLREMAESTSKQLGITFAGITDGKIRRKVQNPLSDAEIEDTTKQTVNTYGAGSGMFTLKFTDEEKQTTNKIETWITNYLSSIKQRLGSYAINITDIIGEKIKSSFRKTIKR